MVLVKFPHHCSLPADSLLSMAYRWSMWGREVTWLQKTLLSNLLTYHPCPAYQHRFPFTFIWAVGYVSIRPTFCRHAQFLEDISKKTTLLLTNEQLLLAELAAWGCRMNVRLDPFFWRAYSPLSQKKLKWRNNSTFNLLFEYIRSAALFLLESHDYRIN